MSVTDGIRKLLAKGFTVEQALDAADAFEGEMPKARTPGALRQERYRNRNKASQGDGSDAGDDTPPPLIKKIPPHP